MKLGWIIVFSISAVFASALRFPEYKVNCDCRPLTTCGVLWANLIAAKLSSVWDHFRYTTYLKSINCGYLVHMPFVCCPFENVDDDSDEYISDLSIDESYIPNLHLDDNSLSVKAPKCSKTPSKGSSGARPPKGNQKSIVPVRTTTALPSTTTQKSNSFEKHHGKENHNFAECGRSINRDHHLGNRTELSDFPWLALLEYDTPRGKKFLCGGALVNDRYILTAAHCVTSRANKLVSVHLGEYDTSTSPDCVPDGNAENTTSCNDSTLKIGVEKTILHDKYNDGIEHREEFPTMNDLALIKLKEKVEFSYYIQPICLPTKPAMPQNYIVAGWSRSFIPNANGYNQKLVSKLTEMELQKCMEHDLLPFVGKEHICAGEIRSIQRACIADAGGPLMGYEKKDDGQLRLTVFGVSYMDLACDRDDLPGVYTRVIDYMPWISEHISN